MPAITSAVVGIGGALLDAKAKKDANKANAAAAAGIPLKDSSFSGPGGMQVDRDVSTGNISVDAGDLEPARKGFVDVGTDAIARASAPDTEGFDASADKLGGFLNNLPPSALAMIDKLKGTSAGLAEGAGAQASSFLQDGFQRGLQDSTFAGAQGLVEGASLTGEDAAAKHLDILRRLAADPEAQKRSSLDDSRFSRGRMGTTGGIAEKVALEKMFADQDLERILASSEEGRRAVAGDRAGVTALSGVGENLAQTESGLTTDAFARTEGSSRLASDLDVIGDDRLMGRNAAEIDQASTGVDLERMKAMFPEELQGAGLDNALKAMTGQGGIFEQGMAGSDAAGEFARDISGTGADAAQALRLNSAPNRDLSPFASVVSEAAATGGIDVAVDAGKRIFGSAKPSPAGAFGSADPTEGSDS